MIRKLMGLLALAASITGAVASERTTGPWDLERLSVAPKVTWIARDVPVQSLYYEGEPYDGKPTRVFAYLAVPEGRTKRVPAMVLVHGGGGTAFRGWVELWAARGYAALAMDLAGRGAERKRLPDGGPDQTHREKFNDIARGVTNAWPYHAVSNVIRAVSLLRTLPAVDPERIGITGISWGGYLTCLVAGLDVRLKVAVPVYGCGFLHENSCWLNTFDQMPEKDRDNWIENFDPSQYLAGCSMPTLFVNGTNDFAYPLDSHRKSYRLVRGARTLYIQVGMKHSHQHGWAPKEIGLFVDSVLRDGAPLPAFVSESSVKGAVTVRFSSAVPVTKAFLHYTADTGAWQKRTWRSVPLTLLPGNRFTANLPAEGGIAYFFTLEDKRGAVVSTELRTLPAASSTATLLLEAEAFDNRGGWVVDQQFMQLMGSPFLLAHGIGVPVEDARTAVEFPAAGTYRVFVRTRDWVAPWKAPGAPGRFQVLVNDTALGMVFGTEGASWHWQDGGTVRIDKDAATVALRDLTGFEGRCDAIVFTTDPAFIPPNVDPAMRDFRRTALGIPEKPEEAGSFDLVVVGGGVAGVCTSVSAARLGLRVALIQDRPVLGGNNSSEVRVWLGGATNFEPFPRIGDIVRELDPNTRECPAPAAAYADNTKMALVQAEKTLFLFLNYHANAVEMKDGRIVAVTAQHTTSGRRSRFTGQWFADTTGDGTIGFLAGADFDVTMTGHMGPTNLWRVVDTGSPVPFPRCPWAIDLSDRPFPHELPRLGRWFWESGFDHDPIEKAEYIRDTNFRAMYGAWDCLKNERKLYPNHTIEWAAYIAGKRESRRLLGDVILSKADLFSEKAYPDGCVPTSWKIDLHLPHESYVKGFEGDAFISRAHFTSYKRPYWVPYRCLYSRNIPNLFMAGRDISVTHQALGTIRVMRTTGMMGEIVGMAASLCKKHDTDPRAVYEHHLAELKELMRRGVGKIPPAPRPEPPAWLTSAGPNLARTATVTVSGCLESERYQPIMLNDGRVSYSDNSLRWVSDRKLPHRAELTWTTPQTISAARIVSGYREPGGRLSAPIQDFRMQYRDGAAWKDIPGAGATGNERFDWSARFSPVTATAVRLLVTASHGNVSRIWELELYDVR